jgi:hypothetical protein
MSMAQKEKNISSEDDDLRQLKQFDDSTRKCYNGLALLRINLRPLLYWQAVIMTSG